MLVILDRQHGNKGAGRPLDPGAAYDLDGDGVRGEHGEREVDLTAAYIEHARGELVDMGHEVLVLSAGSYDARHRLACNAAAAGAPALYLACHVNAGGGRYGLVKYDHRSTGGRGVALLLSRHLGGALAEVHDDVRVAALRPADRGWACIDGIYTGPAHLYGVLVEPGFIDTREHAPLWQAAGLRRIGCALALACDDWNRAWRAPR